MKTIKALMFCAATAGLLILSSLVFAHHGNAAYDEKNQEFNTVKR